MKLFQRNVSTQDLLNSLAEGAVVCDQNGIIIAINKQMETLFGYKLQEVVGRSLNIFLPEHYVNSHPNHLQAFFADPYIRPIGQGLDLTGKRQDGTEFPIEISVSYLPTETGMLGIAFVTDISERHQMEDSLSRTTNLLNQSQRVAKMGSYETDLQTGTWIGSDNFIKLFGLPYKEKYTIEEFQAIVHPDDFDEVMAYFGQCLAEQRDFNYEYRCLRPDGQVIYVSSRSKVFYSADGTPLKIIGIKQDITERKQMEQQLVQQERLAAVGQLAAGIAHDFNNILAGIMGFAELLLISPDTPVEIQPDLRKIHTSGQRAAQLIKQILDFSQKAIRQPQCLDLANLVQTANQFLAPTLPETIQLILNIEPGDYSIEADPTQLQQVITNLALNAQAAMPTGGELCIALAQVEHKGDIHCAVCNEPLTGAWVQLSVTDTGQGIAADLRQRVFEPFFTTKDIGAGSGLGLAQVAGIVAQHHGHISVTSEVEQGTTFTIYLPPGTTDQAMPTSEAAQMKPGQDASSRKGRWG